MLRKYLNEIGGYVKKYKIRWQVLLVTTIFFSVLNAASSYFSAVLIDFVSTNKSLNTIVYIGVLIFVTYIICSLINILKTYIETKISTGLEYGLRKEYFNIVQQSTYIKNLSKESTEIYYRMFNDIGVMASYYLQIKVILPTSILGTILYLSMLLKWSVKLTLFVVVITIVQIIVANKIKTPIAKNTKEVIQNENNFVKEVGEHFSGIETVKILGLEQIKLEKLQIITEKIKKAKIKSTFVTSLLIFISNTISQVGSVGMLLIGSYLILKGELTIGNYIGFNSVMGLFATSVSDIVSLIFRFEEVRISYERYLEFCQGYNANEYGGSKEFKFNKYLEFKNVDFYYTSNKPVLTNVSFKFKPGQMIAIIGESGCGKSTMGKLIMRLIKPIQGEVLLDGENITDIKHVSYKKYVSYLSQVPFIFNSTIRENICIGTTDEVDQEYFNYVINTTGVNKVLERFPDGLDTKIGKDGALLSVGEMQRISIARILLRKPKIIVLDEPTSALNKTYDILISEVFKAYATQHNALVLLITHKEDSLMYADYVYRLTNNIQQDEVYEDYE